MKSKCFSSEKRQHTAKYHEIDDKDSHLLFYAFIAFSLATFIFVGYIGVDHYVEQMRLQNKIENLEVRLEKLGEEMPSYQENKDETNLSNTISKMIDRQQMCDRTSATLNQIASISDGKYKSEQEFLNIWNKSPKPFLHLTASKPTTKLEKENLDGLVTVTGWEQTGGGECGTDPRKDGDDIVIPDGGNYTVYSQIVFHCKTAKEIPVIHRHLVQYIEVFAQFRDTPRPLMENAYQMCGPNDEGKTRISYQSGIYRFNKDDILRVIVNKDEDTQLYDETNDVNKASFGVFSL